MILNTNLEFKSPIIFRKILFINWVMGLLILSILILSRFSEKPIFDSPEFLILGLILILICNIFLELKITVRPRCNQINIIERVDNGYLKIEVNCHFQGPAGGNNYNCVRETKEVLPYIIHIRKESCGG